MDYSLLKKSCGEVFWLTAIAFFPLIISIIYQFIKISSFQNALQTIHPSELIAFCLSFLAPSIFFIKKTHGRGYKLPFLDIFFFTTFFLYILALFFIFMIKNNIDPDIIKNLNTQKDYLIYSGIFLFITIVFRSYSVYHTSKSSDYLNRKKEEQNSFNKTFKESLHGN